MVSKRRLAIIAIIIAIIVIIAVLAIIFLNREKSDQSKDTIAPTKVTGLTVADAKDGKLDLSWNAATDNVAVAKYFIYRDGVKTAESNSTTYQDAGLVNDLTYTYEVSALDGAGNEGQKSSSVDGTPTATVTKQIGTSVATSGDGKNWTVVFSSVDSDMPGNEVHLVIKDKGGTVVLVATELSVLDYGTHDADYIDISGDGDETNDVNAGDYILISTTTYSTGFTFQLIFNGEVVGADTLQ